MQLVFTGLLSLYVLGVGIMMPIVASSCPPASQPLANNPSTQSPPVQLIQAVRQTLSQRLGISPDKLRLVASQPRTWSDGCLGLAQADEICTQALVPGWRLEFTNGQQRWIYRTDMTGRLVRLEPQ
ncbi:MAG: hypothetical protein NZ772_14290 [Cyanobacteria bacterium]|nr:hypothetical protein [Cyanobacteriota bacterium]MDW8201713.1 hypothetical protein [Cyanobacteriota bacterium SKYGB_h_bin112]